MKVRFLHDSCLNNVSFKKGDTTTDIPDLRVEQLVNKDIVEIVKEEVKVKRSRKK